MASGINPMVPEVGTPTTASVRANFATAKAEIENLQSWADTLVLASRYGVVADGATDNSDALDALLDLVDSRGGGLILLPRGVIRITRQWTWGNGSNSQPSQKHHRIYLIGQGTGASAAYTNVQGLGATVIRYDGSVDANAAVLEFAGPLMNVGYSNVEFDGNGKAGAGVRHIHVANGNFCKPVVKNWSANALIFTTRTGFPVGCAYGCGDNVLEQPFVMEPVNFTGTGLTLTSGVNPASTLAGAPDTCRLTVIGGTIFYGGNAGSVGILLHGADNNTIIQTMPIPKGGNAGGGKGVELRQWAGSPVFPHENVLLNVAPAQGILGPGGTGGNTIFLSISDGASVSNPGDMVIHTPDGKITNVLPFARADADGRGYRFDANGTVIGAILRRTNDIRHTATAGNVVFSAGSATETGGNDDLTVLPNEARVRAAGSGNGFTGYAGSTHLFSVTRNSNGLRLAGFDNVTIAGGAATGPTSGTVSADFTSAGNACLGGASGSEAFRAVRVSNAVNRVEAVGGIAGSSAVLRAAGSDASVNLDLTGQGSAGFVRVWSNSALVARFTAVAGDTTRFDFTAGTTAVFLSATGSPTDVDLVLAPKNNGKIRLTAWTSNADAAVNGYITVQDASGTIRKLATIA